MILLALKGPLRLLGGLVGIARGQIHGLGYFIELGAFKSATDKIGLAPPAIWIVIIAHRDLLTPWGF
jgi:hypothetical protein